jgi:hypothetical protein
MSRLNVGNLYNENEDGAPVVSGISTFSSPHYFIPPSGSTAQRPSNPGEGMIRFNTDSGHLEYYTGTHWADVIVNNQELGNQLVTNSAGGTGTRGLRAGGQTPSVTDTIDYVTISTLGNAQDFGNLTVSRFAVGAGASRTRGLFFGGGTPTRKNEIDFVTIASTGDATDFGNLTQTSTASGSQGSNDTRALRFGGDTGSAVNVIDYMTIASTGDAVDFGDISTNLSGGASVASLVRCVLAGGDTASDGSMINTIQYVTISTTGNTQEFGDILSANGGKGLSNSTRGIFNMGNPSASNVLQFITIASTGNSQDFGDLTQNNLSGGAGCCSSSTRGLFMGIKTPTVTNSIEFISILTTGNASDFGDLTQTVANSVACSNGHGGL